VVVWRQFKNLKRHTPKKKEALNMRLKEEHPKERPRTRREQHISKGVAQNEKRTWEMTKEEQVFEDG
jgi:hypothetical protein